MNCVCDALCKLVFSCTYIYATRLFGPTNQPLSEMGVRFGRLLLLKIDFYLLEVREAERCQCVVKPYATLQNSPMLNKGREKIEPRKLYLWTDIGNFASSDSMLTDWSILKVSHTEANCKMLKAFYLARTCEWVPSLWVQGKHRHKQTWMLAIDQWSNLPDYWHQKDAAHFLSFAFRSEKK